MLINFKNKTCFGLLYKNLKILIISQRSTPIQIFKFKMLFHATHIFLWYYNMLHKGLKWLEDVLGFIKMSEIIKRFWGTRPFTHFPIPSYLSFLNFSFFLSPFHFISYLLLNIDFLFQKNEGKSHWIHTKGLRVKVPDYSTNRHN